jgi:hypothetical protein
MAALEQSTATSITFGQGTRSIIDTVGGTLRLITDTGTASTMVGTLSFASASASATAATTIHTLQNSSYSGRVDGTSTITVNGTDTSFWVDSTGFNYPYDYVTALVKNRVKSVMKNNLLIKVNSRQKPLQTKAHIEEQRARLTLRDMLSEQDWRRYVTNGFIMVKGSSDYWYQIFVSSGVNVYKHGKKVHYICIHTDNTCPPSDHVINMKLLVEFDEAALWKGGNIRQVHNGGNLAFQSNSINQSLVEHYRAMKGVSVGSGAVYSVTDNTFAFAC